MCSYIGCWYWCSRKFHPGSRPESGTNSPAAQHSPLASQPPSTSASPANRYPSLSPAGTATSTATGTPVSDKISELSVTEDDGDDDEEIQAQPRDEYIPSVSERHQNDAYAVLTFTSVPDSRASHKLMRGDPSSKGTGPNPNDILAPNYRNHPNYRNKNTLSTRISMLLLVLFLLSKIPLVMSMPPSSVSLTMYALNTNGFGSPMKINSACSRIAARNPNIFVFSETKSAESQIGKTQLRLPGYRILEDRGVPTKRTPKWGIIVGIANHISLRSSQLKLGNSLRGRVVAADLIIPTDYGGGDCSSPNSHIRTLQQLKRGDRKYRPILERNHQTVPIVRPRLDRDRRCKRSPQPKRKEQRTSS